MPATLAIEGVRLRYLVDSRIDGLLADIHRRITAPPMLANPFGKIGSLIREYAARMEMRQSTPAAWAARVLNTITKVPQPGSFVYEGVPLPQLLC